MKKTYLIILILLNLCYAIYAGIISGVSFTNHAPKTNITLFGKDNHVLPSDLEVNFEMYIEQPLVIGQILMIKCGDVMLSLTYIGRNADNCYFVLNPTYNKKKYIEIPFDASRCSEGQWFNMSINIAAKAGSATLLLDKKAYTLKGLDIKIPCNYNVFFGPNDAGLSDVPLMAVANITIKENGADKYAFPLNESNGEIAVDTLSGIRAEVKHAVWLINSHHYWKHLGSYRAAKIAGITYDSKRNNLIIVNNDSLTTIGLKDRSYISRPLEGRKIEGFSGEAVYNSEQDIVIHYNLYDGDGITQPFVAKIDMDGKVLNYSVYEFHNPLHHHAMIWDPLQQQINIFGGYGNYAYSDKLLRFDESDNKWDTLTYTGDRITPRMHTVAGVGEAPHLFYIYGGVGNETGKQELGKEFYSDLYLLNTKTLKVKKLWSVPNEVSHLVPKRNLVIDKDQNAVFLLCTNRNNGKIGLYAFDLSTGKHRRVSDETLVNTNCIHSTAYLFFDKQVQNFYMAIRQSDDSLSYSTVELFSLNAPPITFEELKVTAEEKKSANTLAMFVIIIFVLAGFLALYYFIRRRKLKNAIPEDNDKQEIPSEYDAVFNELVEKKRNAIYIFGEFTVINKEGINISARFSSKIKQLFTLILLNSIRYNEGVSTEKLSLTLWSNKDVSDAKNIRGVTINHLRNLLKEMEGITLDYNDERWELNIEDPCYCDYKDAIHIQKQEMSLTSVVQLLHLLKRGPLLPAFYQYNWFENSKIEYDEFLFNQLENGMPLLAENKCWNECILAANILFSFDHLNEIAIQYKLTALIKLGKAESAQRVYDRFCKEYLICYNEKYKKKFTEFSPLV